MIQKVSQPKRLLGADVGATLAKLAVRDGDDRPSYRLVPIDAIERVAQEVESLRPARIGLTGGGAPELAARLSSLETDTPFDTVAVLEFDAWAEGAAALQRESGIEPLERYLVVSLGTGTSALLVNGGDVTRVGGTALGGGTAAGLAAALLGPMPFEELAELAREGDRRRVDLLVSDIYRSGDAPLPGDLNAASFARLARPGHDGRAKPADLAHAVMGLVGENVALITCGLAAAADVKRIVFGGSTLRGNPALVGILTGLCTALGREPVVPEHGEFAGALGALSLLGG